MALSTRFKALRRDVSEDGGVSSATDEYTMRESTFKVRKCFLFYMTRTSLDDNPFTRLSIPKGHPHFSDGSATLVGWDGLYAD